ncbi:hypothetical protein HW115_01930 [Verrucomicrobiaceae bacterium N1E253]|uniref:Lipoprotein n=1 Tax=Oceaniferula marina TaxID=2748318 RepID=A0A851G9S2_9BACT|nr:hypothetical protein [Oceaniferula marina]NWK54353.1 hypothetical protein [Oceaniferula marina]
MNLKSKAFLPLGLALLVGACSPFYPKPHPNNPGTQTPSGQPTLTPEQQKILEQSQQGNGVAGVDAAGNPTGVDSTVLTPGSDGNTSPTPPTNTNGKKNYPTASPVPGKPGFVFNPYTHNIVDVKGIASGKLCRDPEDPDETHKFRVP